MERPVFKASRFGALRHADYRNFFVGQLASVCGDWLQQTALAWQAFELTGESTWPALLMVAQLLPSSVLSPLGGRLCDQYPRKKILFLSQGGLLAVAMALTVLSYQNRLSIPIILGFAGMAGVLNGVDYPARSAFVKNLVPAEHLVSAVSLGAILVNTGKSLGPALAGFFLATGNVTGCLATNAATYVLVLVTLVLIGNSGHPTGGRAVARPRGSGFAVLKKYPGMTAVVAVMAVFSFCGWPYLSLLPGFADSLDPTDEDLYPFLVSAAGAGALLAAVMASGGTTPGRRRWSGNLACVGIPVGLFCLGLADSKSLAVLFCAVIGFSLVQFFTTAQAVLQLKTRTDEQGRVIASLMLVTGFGILLGNLLLGPAADHFGLKHTLLTVSGLASVGTVVFVGSRVMDRLEERGAQDE